MAKPAILLRHALCTELALFALSVLFFLSAPVVWAQSASSESNNIFKDFELKPSSGQYMVMRGANVRAKPETKGQKIGTVKKGSRVEAVGWAKGAWMAVRKNGRDLGFVYANFLVPLIDGALNDDINGKVAVAGGGSCRYTVHFEGKSVMADEPFEIADYTITFRCESRGKKFEFSADMFMTEAPYQLSQKPYFQITIDLREVSDSLEESFSTNMMYRRTDGKVVFDSVNQATLQAKTKNLEAAADDVKAALSAAVEISARAWNAKVWGAVGGG